jgi:hypothetical protein
MECIDHVREQWSDFTNWAEDTRPPTWVMKYVLGLIAVSPYLAVALVAVFIAVDVDNWVRDRVN